MNLAKLVRSAKNWLLFEAFADVEVFLIIEGFLIFVIVIELVAIVANH